MAITGITGTRSAAGDSISAAYARVSAATELPVVTGFGIRTPEQAGEAASRSDGAIVGSAVVEIIADNLGPDGKGTPETVSKIAAFVGDLAEGVAGTAGVFLSVIVIMKNTGSHPCSHLAMGSAILNFPYRMSQRVQMTVTLWCLSTSRISGTATDRVLFNSICQIMVQPLIAPKKNCVPSQKWPCG